MAWKFNIKDFSTEVSTSVLPTRAVDVISAAAIEQLKDIKNLRTLGLVDKVDEGTRTYVYFRYDDLTGAYDRSELEDFKYDSAGATQYTATMLEIAKGFQISWEADHLAKLAIRAAQTRACIIEVKDREDLKIATALRTSAALTSTVTATAVLSGTSADPVSDIRQGIRKINDLGYEPDTLLLENVNLEELISIIGSNEWYGITEAAIRSGNLPNFMGLKVINLPAAKMTHGSAVILKTGSAGAFQMGQAHDVRLKIFDDNDSHSTKVQVFERVIPVVSRPDAGALITGW